MKDFTVYERGKVKVFINQCYNPKKKTKLFAIRRDDKSGLGRFIGTIRFSGAWRQYVTEFEKGTIWSAGCKEKIVEFEKILNKQFRDKLKKEINKGENQDEKN